MKKSTDIKSRSSSKAIYKFLINYLIKKPKTKDKYFTQRMHILSTASHERKNPKNNLLTEMYFQNW